MYNVEKYVSRCLNSVLGQVNTQVEVIIIDDGSSDDSKRICEDIISQSKSKIKFISQNNTGLSATRNKGMDMANGEYIMFLDSDDELGLNAVPKLLEGIKKYPDVDVFYFDAKTVDEINDGKQRNKYNRKKKIDELVIFDSLEYFTKYYVDTLIVSACLCLIKKEILDCNNIRFDEGRLYEDNVFSLNILLKSQKVCYLPYDLYIRRYRQNSITTKRISDKNILDICYVIKRLLEIKGSILDIDSEVTCNAFVTLVYKMYTWGNNMMLEAGKNIECFDQINKEVIEVLSEWPEKYKGCSYYLSLYFMSQGKNFSCVDDVYVKKKINEYYLMIFDRLKNCESKRIALYGRGKHTQILLEEYAYKMGSELKFTVYADTYLRTGIEEDGKKIVNIEDIKKYADVIIISSYQYRLEMLKKCRDLQLDIEIVDLYEVEKMNLFDERLMF